MVYNENHKNIDICIMLKKICDTIVAITTGNSNSTIGIIRLSGKLSYNICLNIVKKKVNPGSVTYANFFDKDNILIDFGLVLFFKSPKSYTGEDVIEFHLHGNKFILDSLVFRSIELGARLADPGEYTFRAFINNKMDLLQSESVNQLINANSLYSTRNILKSLNGDFSKKINILLDMILDIRKNLEVSIDHSEFIEFDQKSNFEKFLDIEKFFLNLMSNISSLNYNVDIMKAVIVGPPNVGKSSLFNLILGENRSIVSNISGTTRDYIDRDININNIVFSLVDTAGLKIKTSDVIEESGIRKSIEQIKSAFLLIYIVDININIDDFHFKNILKKHPNIKNFFLIKNKIDLFGYKPKIIKNKYFTEIHMSVLTKNGFDLFLNSFKKIASNLNYNSYVLCDRNFNLLINFKNDLYEAKKLFFCDYKIDLLAEKLKFMHSCLASILGKDFSEDLISKIFSSFCLGK